MWGKRDAYRIDEQYALLEEMEHWLDKLLKN